MTLPNTPIAIADETARLFIAHPAGDAWETRQIAEQGAWPTWNPDGHTLAVSAVDLRAGVSSVETLDIEGRTLRLIHRAASGGPLIIAPGVPHYVNWSPSGRFLSHVSQGEGGLDLRITHRDGMLSGELVAHGAPLFSAWAPDERYLAVHAGTELQLYDLDLRETVATFPGAVGFRTPAFTADGNVLLYATPAPPGVALMWVDLPAMTTREIARFAGGVALLPRPNSDVIAVAVSGNPDSGIFDRVWLDGAESGRSIRGPFMAAAWSPDGERLALHIAAQNGDGRYGVQVFDAAAKFVAATEPIFLSAAYRTMLTFFDQYMYSHCTWDPRASSLLLAGRLPGDGVHATFGDPVNLVLAWQAAPNQPLRVVHRGDIGFFAPSP